MEAGRATVADGSGPRPHQQPCVGVGGGLKVRGPNLQLLGDDLQACEGHTGWEGHCLPGAPGQQVVAM